MQSLDGEPYCLDLCAAAHSGRGTEDDYEILYFQVTRHKPSRGAGDKVKHNPISQEEQNSLH